MIPHNEVHNLDRVARKHILSRALTGANPCNRVLAGPSAVRAIALAPLPPAEFMNSTFSCWMWFHLKSAVHN